MSIVVTYYPTLADAIAASNPLFEETAYTLTAQGDLVTWAIYATGTTGTSPATQVYLSGATLNSDGAYSVYPANVNYYPTAADALTNTNLVAALDSFTVTTQSGFVTWAISSSSSGAASQSNVYTTDTLDTSVAGGVYYLFPANTAYYPTRGDAVANTNLIIASESFILASQTYGPGPTTTIAWAIAPASTGAQSKASVYTTETLDSSVTGGIYYLFPANVNYFDTAANATANTNMVYSTDSFTLLAQSAFGSGTFNTWAISSISTVVAPTTLAQAYLAGADLTATGIYALYPGNTLYYPTKIDAENNTNMLASSETFTVAPQSPISNWALAVPEYLNPGPSLADKVYTTDVLTDNAAGGVYALFPANVNYFANPTDAADNQNMLASTDSYTVIVATYNSWRISPTLTTGSAAQNAGYIPSGPALSSDGIYFMYPAAVTYYPTKADALANTSFIDSSTSYTLAEEGIENLWGIASTSTGTSLQTQRYAAAEVLTPDGVYAVFPAHIIYYPTSADETANTNAICEDSFTLSEQLSNTFWIIAPGSIGISTDTLVYQDGDTLNTTLVSGFSPHYYVYPLKVAYFASKANALALGATLSIDDNYTVAVHVDSLWAIASNSTGATPRTSAYSDGFALDPAGAYFLYPANTNYYSNEANALANTGMVDSSESYTVQTVGPRSSWRLASTSTGSSSQSIVYVTGTTLNSDGIYYLYPILPCFLEGSTILCQVDGVDVYKPVEEIRAGTLVKTAENGYLRVQLIGRSKVDNPGHTDRTQNRLYKCSKEAYPELKEDLYITGCHSILVDDITETERAGIIKEVSRIFITGRKYRLMACVDQRAEPWASENTYTVWHFALENADPRMNYGVYANGGLLVETATIQRMREKSNMELM